jgi:hypothetical protein
VANCCECGNQPSGSIKCRELLDQLRNCQLSGRTLLHGVSYIQHITILTLLWLSNSTIICYSNPLLLNFLLCIQKFVTLLFFGKGANTLAVTGGDTSWYFVRNLPKTQAGTHARARGKKVLKTTLLLAETHFLATGCSGSDTAVCRPRRVIKYRALTLFWLTHDAAWIPLTVWNINKLTLPGRKQSVKSNFMSNAPWHPKAHYLVRRCPPVCPSNE